jgi:hypothetical protein
MLALPYLAGVAGGLIIVRLAPTAALESAPIRGFGCGLASGFVLGVAAAFSGGPLGNNRMASVGPSPWQVAIVAALEIGIAAAVTAGAANWWYVRKRWPAAKVADTSPAEADTSPPASSWVPGARHPVEYANHYVDQDAGHRIYVNRWADDQDEAADHRRPRPRGPSALP